MEQNRTEIQESINTELKNNVYKYITPYRLRLVLSKIKESFFNIVDDTAEKIKFSSPQFVSTNVKTALEEALSGGLTTGFGTLDFQLLDPNPFYSAGRYRQLKITGGSPNEKLTILFHTGLPEVPNGYNNYTSGGYGQPVQYISGVGAVNQTLDIGFCIIGNNGLNQNVNDSYGKVNRYGSKYSKYLFTTGYDFVYPSTFNTIQEKNFPISWVANYFVFRDRHITDDYSFLVINSGKSINFLSSPVETQIELDSNGEFLFTDSWTVGGTITSTAYYIKYSVEILQSDKRLINDTHGRKISNYIYPTPTDVSYP